MTRSVVFSSNGEPVSVSRYSVKEEAEGDIVTSSSVDDITILNTWYKKGGIIKERAPRPSDDHFWNRDLEIWDVDLGRLMKTLKAEVDSHAETLRTAVITPGSGQSMTYEAKHREASRYPSDPPFPFLEAEAESLGMTTAEVARSVLDARAEWERIGSQIEARRLKAKQDIRAATAPAEMYAIVKEFKEWQ